MLSVPLSATLPERIQICQESTLKNAPSLFVSEPKTLTVPQACRSTRRWRFFRHTDAKKYYLLVDCLDRLCLAGYNQSGDGREDCLLLLRSHPARRRGYGPAGQTCSVQVGRGEWRQSGSRPSYIMDNSP